MATLEKIRGKAGLVILVIGIGMAAFLLTDLMNSSGSLFRRAELQIASIDGTDVSYEEYQKYITELEDFYKLNGRSASMDENMSFQMREQAWESMVQDVIMNEKYEELGISVTADELLEMATGKDAHPQIKQMFTNPQTGVFDKNQVVNFLQRKNQDPQANFYWYFLEKQIKKERLFAKYGALLKKGFYVTTAQAKAEAEAKQNSVDFQFVVKRFSAIADSTIAVSSSEVNEYYKANAANYKQKATRDIEYVSFEIKPSEEDRKMAEEWMKKSIVEFSNPSTDAVQYVNMNSDVEYVNRSLKLEQISSNLQGFAASAQVGEVFGPYFENEAFKATRLVDVIQVPDSVKARHILVEDPALADSLFNLVKKGGNFADIARNNSKDPGSAINGGDLGWFSEGTMVKPFNDACFNGKKGDIVKVETQFGIHIINIQEIGKTVTKYNLATLEKEVTYSSKTNQAVYGQAAKFATQNKTYDQFNEAIQKDNLVKRYGRSLGSNDRAVANLEQSRQIVRWAFETEKNVVSEIFECGDEYIVAFVTTVREEGTQPLNMVQSGIERELRNKKKAEKIIAEIKSNKPSDINALASTLGAEVQTANNIAFGAFQVPGAGVEPALVALATSAKQGELSAPVAGNNGVYVVNVTGINTVSNDVETEKATLQQNLGFKIDYQALQTIKSNAEIVDERIKFF